MIRNKATFVYFIISSLSDEISNQLISIKPKIFFTRENVSRTILNSIH